MPSEPSSSASAFAATDFSQFPDAGGHFGRYGGQFVAETLMAPLAQLHDAYRRYLCDPEFLAVLDRDLREYVGRPSPLYHAKRWSDRMGGAQVYLKREDLNHTGSHKVNNTVGQALLAQRMGRLASLPRPARASMASPPPPSPRVWA